MDILEAAKEQVKKERILRAMVRELEEMLIISSSKNYVLSGKSEPSVRDLKRNIRRSLADELDLDVDLLVELGSN